MTDRNLEIAMMGIKVALIAIAITFILEAISIFLPSLKVSPFLLGAIYLIMAGYVLYWAIKTGVPK